MCTHVFGTSLHQAMDRPKHHHTLQFTFMSHRSLLVVLWKTLRKWCPVLHLVAEHPVFWTRYRDCSGKLSFRVAERRRMTYGDVERSRRESIAQHVQWHGEQSAH